MQHLHQPHSTDQTSLKWSPESMMLTKTVSDVQISPSYDSVLFVATSPKLKEEGYRYISHIYQASMDGSNSTLFSNPETSSMQPRFSPDGQTVAFISMCKGIRSLFCISKQGGEASLLFTNKKNIKPSLGLHVENL
jgi:dipeptidyl aminopeptidase/acylaminoacyl peptidase